MKQSSAWRSAMGLAVLAVTTLLGGCPNGSRPAPKPTTGNIAVNIGFGAGSNPPGTCDSVTTTVGLTDGQTKQVTIGGGLASTQAPACRGGTTFTGLQPGEYVVKSFADCAVTVRAGETASVYVRSDVRQCVGPW